MARINLHSMQILSTVASTNSFTRAALELHMTPSAVSKRIAELESRFGTPLLMRQSSGLWLTPAGEIVVRYADDLMARVAEMSREIGDLLSQQRGEIKIMSNTTAILLGLLEDISHFRGSHPGVRIIVTEGGSVEIAEAVKRNAIDIGVCVKTARMSGLSILPYRQTGLAVVAPESHPLAARPSLGASDLSDHHIVWTPPIPIVDNRLDFAEAPGDISLQVRSFDVVLRSVQEGVGIAVVPVVVLPSRLPAGLAVIPLDISPARFEVVVCHDPSVHADASKQQLIAWLQSKHAEHFDPE